MRHYLLLFLLSLAVSPSVFAYSIGHQTQTVSDISRSRDIEYELYYPADSNGEAVPLAAGSEAFPVLVFGHGFVMGTDAYMNLVELLVPQGYLLLLPTTEDGFSPSHDAFAEDLIFLAEYMHDENANSSSMFFERLNGSFAAMGHSMGGGSSFLAAANSGLFTVLCNLAAAETSPSAIAAAADVQIPALLFSGDADCITPPAEHQDPMYDSIRSLCKTQIYIKDGTHCYFANSNVACAAGETFCNPFPDISREDQQAVLNSYLLSWLNLQMKSSGTWTSFRDEMEMDARISFRSTCTESTAISRDHKSNNIRIWPMPLTSDELFIESESPLESVQLLDMNMQSLGKWSLHSSKGSIPCGSYPSGIYFVVLKNFIGTEHHRLMLIP